MLKPSDGFNHSKYRKNKIQVVDLLKIVQLMNVQAHGFKT